MSKLLAKKPKDVKPGRIKGLLYGRPGSGKTWFALNFPSPFYIDTEGGADLPRYQKKLESVGGVYLGKEDGSCDFDVIIGQLKALATETHPYRTLIIDSLTKVFQDRQSNEYERIGYEYGRDKKAPTAKMRQLLSWMDKVDMNVWVVAYEKPVFTDNKQDQGAPDIIIPAAHELDLSLRIQQINEHLRQATVDKTRLEHFPGMSRFPLQEKGQDVGYAEFLKRYSREAIEADSVPLDLAAAEQLGTIDRLCYEAKVPQEKINDVLDRAGVDQLKELTATQADAFIKWLTKKIEGEKK